MTKVSQLILDVRYVGESIASISQDIQLLLPGDYNNDVNVMKRAKHAKGLVENIISVLTFLNTIDYKSLDMQEGLSNEVRKIEFSCFGLQSLLSQALINAIIFRTYEKEINKFIKVVNTSANRLITISFIAKHKLSETGNDGCFKGSRFNEERSENGDVAMNEIDLINKGDVCFRDKATCELDCDGVCYKDDYNNDDEMPTGPGTINKFKDINNYDISSKEVGRIGSEDVCYKDRETCELDCDGICYKDKTSEELSKCPEYSESFTESTLTLVESGYDQIEQDYWRKQTEENNYGNEELIINNGNEENTNTADDAVLFDGFYNVDMKRTIDTLVEKCDNETEQASDNFREINDEHLNSVVNDVTLISENTVIIKVENYDYLNDNDILNEHNANLDSFVANDAIKPNDQKVDLSSGDNNTIVSYEHSIQDFETIHKSENQITTDNTDLYSTDATITNYETGNTNETNEVEISLSEYESTTEVSTTENYESTIETPTTTVTSYDSYDATTSNYETSSDNTETTPYSYETYTTTETTTPAYETTTEDLYKVSQDIYSAAQDLSTKANEISSITSDISSKVSNINSMVSDLNSYDDDELSKKVQSVSKITQELSSKTSEISSLCSTTSSLASDISSASSDMPSADRNHRFKTSPWQKMSAKCQDMVTACQAIVTTAQDILTKMETILSTTADLKVAEAVSTGVYEVTTKTQLVISETLNIVSAVIELMNVIES